MTKPKKEKGYWGETDFGLRRWTEYETPIWLSDGYEQERNYRLRDLFWLLPLCVLVLALGSLIGLFYYFFPHQLIWLMLWLPIMLIVILMPKNP